MSEIALFCVLLALAIKGVVDTYDWARGRIKKSFDKENADDDEKRKIKESIKEIMEDEESLWSKLDTLSEKVNTLIDSDKDDIKSWITEKHHFYCYEQKWIDDYSLECIEKRYGHYTKEGGNTFIGSFMKELRALPKRPPEIKK
jgi:hypothetical protein